MDTPSKEGYVTTTLEPPARASALVRGWRGFRRWRRSRPFWGGFFLILSGVRLFLSGNMDLGNIQVHFGPEGYLSYLLPALMLLCGLFVWLMPAQRAFFSIIGAGTAVFSLIGLNLGGFVLGMLFGMIGGALGFGWVPRTPTADEATDAPSDSDEPDGAQTAELDAATEPAAGTTGDQPDDAVTEIVPWDARWGASEEQPSSGRSGVLTDLLPPPTAPFPGAATLPPTPRHAVEDEEAGSPPSGGTGPRRTPRLMVTIALPLIVAAGTLAVVVRSPGAAFADTCPTASATSTATTTAPTPSTEVTTSTAASLTGIIGDIIGGVLGIDATASADPTPTPTSTTPTATPTTTGGSCDTGDTGSGGSSGGGSSGTGSGSSSGSGSTSGSTKLLAVAAGQPKVNETPSKMTADVLTLTGFSYDGLVDLPTGSGSIRVMQFSMDKSVSDGFTLTAAGDHPMKFVSDKLTVKGNVKFYCSRFSAYLLGIKLTFTVDSPPPITLPLMIFTDAVIDLVFVDSDTLTAKNLVNTVS